METFEAITTRKSIRKYLDTPVPDELINKCLEAARWAPSGGNSQPWRFVVVRDREKMKRFDPYHKQPWVSNASVLIVCCMDQTSKWTKYDESFDNYLIGFLDLGAAIQNFLLAAHDAGLGAVWVGAFSPKKVRELCLIPKHLLIISLICVGHFDQTGTLTFRERTMSNKDSRPRKPLSESCFSETYGVSYGSEKPYSESN